jgi:hypothetical protein
LSPLQKIGAVNVPLILQGVVENMLPNELELQSQVLGELDSLRQPLATSSRFKQKKKGKGNPNPLSVKQTKGEKKKKRVGPRLRKARLAEAAGDADVGGGAEGVNAKAGKPKKLKRTKKNNRAEKAAATAVA